MDIHFCDQCAARVTDGDLRAGRGIKRGDIVICGRCLEYGLGKDLLSSAAAVRPTTALVLSASSGSKGRLVKAGDDAPPPRSVAPPPVVDEPPVTAAELGIAPIDPLHGTDPLPEPAAVTTPAAQPTPVPAIAERRAFAAMAQEDTRGMPGGPAEALNQMAAAFGALSGQGPAQQRRLTPPPSSAAARSRSDVVDLADEGAVAVLGEIGTGAGSDKETAEIGSVPPPSQGRLRSPTGHSGRRRTQPPSSGAGAGDPRPTPPPAAADFPRGPGRAVGSEERRLSRNSSTRGTTTRTGGRPVSRSRRRSGNQNLLLIVGGVAAACVLALIIVMAVGSSSGRQGGNTKPSDRVLREEIQATKGVVLAAVSSHNDLPKLRAALERLRSTQLQLTRFQDDMKKNHGWTSQDAEAFFETSGWRDVNEHSKTLRDRISALEAQR